MIVKHEIYDLRDFSAWSGAVDTKDKICNAGMGEAFMSELGEIYTEGIGRCQLNDLLWFEEEFCLHLVGLKTDDEESENDENE